MLIFFFFSSRRRHTRYWRDWSSDVCSSDLGDVAVQRKPRHHAELYGLLVGDRQRPRVPEADRAGVSVRRLAVGNPAAAEHLGRGRQVGVKLQPYDRLVSPSLLHFQVNSPSPLLCLVLVIL